MAAVQTPSKRPFVSGGRQWAQKRTGVLFHYEIARQFFFGHGYLPFKASCALSACAEPLRSYARLRLRATTSAVSARAPTPSITPMGRLLSPVLGEVSSEPEDPPEEPLSRT